jgi:hypothetical protein
MLVLTVGCADDDEGVSSDEDARRAYLGIDASVEKALNLGMDGFNAASSANIPAQSTEGEVSGTITIAGQVDQGTSPNKGMRLSIELVDYSDGPAVRVEDDDIDITYETEADALPFLELKLRDIPDGTFTGTLLGDYHMHGDLEGTVKLDLSMSGTIEDDGNGGIARVLGETTVTGVAVAGDGTYHVDLSI